MMGLYNDFSYSPKSYLIVSRVASPLNYSSNIIGSAAHWAVVGNSNFQVILFGEDWRSGRMSILYFYYLNLTHWSFAWSTYPTCVVTAENKIASKGSTSWSTYIFFIISFNPIILVKLLLV